MDRILSVIQYRSGSRYVVLAEAVDEAESEVVYGPDTLDRCEAYVSSKLRDWETSPSSSSR